MDFSTLIAISGMVLVLSFLVIIHELGHYIAARWMKIKVEEFGVGYPPRALTLFKKWGTIFSLNWIPFGGFVRMEGEDGVDSEHSQIQDISSQEGPFYSKTIGQRLVVILAGATVNFIFGVIAFSIIFSIVGIPGGALVVAINPGSPAENAGLPLNQAIIKAEVGGKTFDIRGANQLLNFTSTHYGQEVTITSLGPCEEHRCENVVRVDRVTLRPEAIARTEGALGVSPGDFTRFYPWYEMPFRGAIVGIEQALLLGWSILQALGQMVTNLVAKGVVPSEVSGPVGIVNDARKTGVFAQGPVMILLFMAVISINLAVMNLLPIPALDGGRAFFLLFEKFVGKKTIERVEGYANYLGYMLLLTLIVLITARDIFRIFGT